MSPDAAFSGHDEGGDQVDEAFERDEVKELLCRPYDPLLPHGNKPSKPWQVTVDVYLNQVFDAWTADFEIKTCVQTIQGADPRRPVIVFNNLERPGYSIDFRLFDNTGEHYTFADENAEPVWSKLGADCPRTSCNDVFDPGKIKVAPDGLTLTVFNPNKTQVGQFFYTLRLTKDGGRNFVHLDPGGVNQNGNY